MIIHILFISQQNFTALLLGNITHENHSYYDLSASTLQCDCERLLKDKRALSYPVAPSSSSCFIILRTKKVQHIQPSLEFPMTVHQTVKFSFA